MGLCCRDKSLVVFTRWDQLRGQIPLKYSHGTYTQSLRRLSADLVRRSVGVASNGSQIVAIAQIYSGAEEMFSIKLFGDGNSAVPRKKNNLFD